MSPRKNSATKRKSLNRLARAKLARAKGISQTDLAEEHTSQPIRTGGASHIAVRGETRG